ncbi:MAG: alpha/beta hydrolase [Pseudobdellovibrionaceae bacterium]
MKNLASLLGILLISLTVSAQTKDMKAAWNLSSTHVILNSTYINLRSGYIKEREDIPFRGNILYYQGLGDSILNHDPLFSKLSDLGFRVIAFDYFGQGGSEGSMNSTTIARIDEIGRHVFAKLSKKNCEQCNDVIILGWSTGGLAAYRDAFLDAGTKIKKVILIAPGISPNVIVGEGLISWPPDRISLRSLTTANYGVESNPHVDPIKPESPIEVPKFSLDLFKTSLQSKNWVMSKNIRGFVLLSDPKEDTYVNAIDTEKVLKKNAKHFSYKFYTGARHEIDNERSEISKEAVSDIIKFLLDQ